MRWLPWWLRFSLEREWVESSAGMYDVRALVLRFPQRPHPVPTGGREVVDMSKIPLLESEDGALFRAMSRLPSPATKYRWVEGSE